jgi:hypothetical protein
MDANDNPVRLDLNNPVFQEHLFGLQKPERNSAIDTLRKIRLLSWGQLYRDSGLKWEKIVSVKPPMGVNAIYSLRITQSRRCTAYRDGDFMRLLTVAPDHDSTYGRK